MKSEHTKERLLSRDEVEERYGIPKRFLEKAACRDEGPRRVKIGRLVKYRPKDVAEWIERNTTPEANR